MILTSPDSLGYVPKKIISLVPSQTELLYYLGLERETIGITKFCIHPEAWFKTKTRIGGTKSLNIEKINELGPDLIIANTEENVKEQVELLAQNFPVWVTDVIDLNDSIKMINNIGQLVGKEPKATDLQSRVKNKFNAFGNVVASIKRPLIPAAYLIWREPIMTIGGDTFINDMMKRCGFQNIFETSTRYPITSIDELKQMGCKLLLLSSEPFPFGEKHIAEFEEKLPGVKIILADGEMFSWYGSRLLEATGYFGRLVRELKMNN
ncbi:MAG: helical backbone metal receptor [Ferruginibacter sp.]